MELLEKRCDLLGLSILNAAKEKDGKPLSEDLKDSIGQLVQYVFFFHYCKCGPNCSSTEAYGTL